MTSDIEKLLIAEEGEVLHAYPDPLGYLTIGVGHLIDPKKGGCISQRISRLILREDIETARAGVIAALPWAADLDEVRLDTLVAMAFQMGVAGLLKFKLTLVYLRGDHFDKAADEMLDSTWARQTPARARRMAERIRTGVA